MAKWYIQNSIRMTFGNGVVTFNEGDTIDDTLYDVSKILLAGGQLVPQMAGSNAAATQAVGQHKRGAFDVERMNQPQWGMYARAFQITVANTASNATYALSPAEPDASYFVQASASALSAGANGQSAVLAGFTKTAGNLVLAVETAPGSSQSVTFDVLLYRA